MIPKSLRFRQVHLDFHTSPDIEGIGAAWDKAAWQETLRAASVDSITCFSKCHHGLSYHPTTVGVQHPHLKFDLLRAQMDACKEIDVRVPVYLSAGLDNTITKTHPEWREIDAEGRLGGWNTTPLQPGFHKLCFNTPYLDYLCRQIEEAVTLFPDADGIFLDIIFQGACCCNWCMEAMAREGLDPTNPEHRERNAWQTLQRYYQATTAACKCRDAAMPVFHNAGMFRWTMARNNRQLLSSHSHLELESLPTGGWGYDHFPESSSYATRLGLDYLGMTGKFHLSWGEFGGFKHPNALRYECAAMTAFGAKCSVGDQLHPNGLLDRSTYETIAAAYSEVAEKEPWCRDSEALPEIAILSSVTENGPSEETEGADTGACRMLLEGHWLFALTDRLDDFGAFKVLILPDAIAIDEALKTKIDAFLAAGGKLILSGRSGLHKNGQGLAWDIGADYFGESPYSPDYLLPAEGFRPAFISTPSVSYGASHRIKATSGRSLGQVFDPYFNRAYNHFCSHQHTPYRPEPSGYEAGVIHGNIAYLAHPVFSIYRWNGTLVQRELILRVLDTLLGATRRVKTNLPTGGRITLRRQVGEKREIVHLLYASKQTRGGHAAHRKENSAVVEVIEDLEPLANITVSVLPEAPIARATLEPQGTELPIVCREGRVEFTVPSFTCHQMVVLHEVAARRGIEPLHQP